LATAALFLISACHDANAAANNTQADAPPSTATPSAPSNDAAPVPVPETPPNGVNTGGFQPLGSQAVKDAIHHALNTGTTQRWQDGALSGYVVPSQTTDAHGCRAVRYTVDQQPASSYPVITACDAGRSQ
jgi:hypothetical protein